MSLLNREIKEEIDLWVQKFPEGKQRSAIIAALHSVQHFNNGFLTSELMNEVAEYLDVPKIQVFEVASFYSMFNTQPVGKHEISVCTNISCMLRGSDEIVDHIEKRLQIKTGESPADGNIFRAVRPTTVSNRIRATFSTRIAIRRRDCRSSDRYLHRLDRHHLCDHDDRMSCVEPARWSDSKRPAGRPAGHRSCPR